MTRTATPAEELERMVVLLEGKEHVLPWEVVEHWIEEIRPLVATHWRGSYDEFAAIAAELPPLGGRRDIELAKLQRDRLARSVRGLLRVEATEALLWSRAGEPKTVIMKTTKVNSTGVLQIGVLGDNASAQGLQQTQSVVQAPSDSQTVTKEEYRAALSQLEVAVDTLRGELDKIDSRIYDFSTDILIRLRKSALMMEANAATVSSIQSHAKSVADDLAAKQFAADVKPQMVKSAVAGFELLGKIAENPIAQSIVKGMIAAG